MAAEDKKVMDRKKRGQVPPEEIKACLKFKTEHLIGMLDSADPQKRTIAAAVLGDIQDEKSIMPLCAALKGEKALYSRIAVSEALEKMGEDAVQPLIELLGKIGNNQEIELPKKYFNKKSFPLARDMAARTIIKIGKPATPHLIKVVEEQDNYITQQAIDTLGGISAKTGDMRALPVLLNGLESHSSNKITLWKIIRSLSAFKHSSEALPLLLNILENDPCAAIIWETARTLGQIGINRPDIMDALSKLEKHQHPEIKKAAKNAIINLKNV
jgi:FOG: HEAT repeat